MRKLCVVSMSGGLDSTTLARRAIEDGYQVLPVNIKYGQKNKVELQAFKKVYETLLIQHGPKSILTPTTLDLTVVMDGALATYEKLREAGTIEEATEMEFYTPSRNLVFTTLASMLGEIAAYATGKTELKIGLGIHKHEHYDRDYWDITPEFVKKLNEVFALNDCMSVEMYAPYAEVSKDKIVEDAIKLNVPILDTWTCYDPKIQEYADGIKATPCLKCEACIERQAAGDKAGFLNINEYVLKL